MSEDSVYQALRGSPGYLRLSAAAEALPAELDHAQKNKLGHSAFLGRLLEVEVAAARGRKDDARRCTRKGVYRCRVPHLLHDSC